MTNNKHTTPEQSVTPELVVVASIVGALLVLFMLALLALVIIFGWTEAVEIVKSPATASWAQAIVSIIAVIAGAGAINWQVKYQAKKQKRTAQKQEKQKLSIILSSLNQTKRHLDFAIEKSKNNKEIKFVQKIIEEAVELIRKISIFDMIDSSVTHTINDFLIFYTISSEFSKNPSPEEMKKTLMQFKKLIDNSIKATEECIKEKSI